MRSGFLICLVTAILAAPPVAWASDLPELFIPVSGQEEQQVRRENQYFLKLHNYFAKRHRIVRVNTGVLFNAPRFRITFFDDMSISVRRDSITYNGESKAMFSWTGRMENQPIAPEDFLSRGHPPDRANDAYAAVVEVSIAGSSYVYDPKTGRSSSLASRDSKTLRPTASVDRSKGQYKIRAIQTEISPLSLSTTFRLKPLETDKRYHVLIETDPAKILSPGIEGGPRNEAEREFRIQQYKQFVESLGPDPRHINNRPE